MGHKPQTSPDINSRSFEKVSAFGIYAFIGGPPRNGEAINGCAHTRTQAATVFVHCGSTCGATQACCFSTGLCVHTSYGLPAQKPSPHCDPCGILTCRRLSGPRPLAYWPHLSNSSTPAAHLYADNQSPGISPRTHLRLS